MKAVRIVSDGSPQGTHVFVEGVKLNYVTDLQVRWDSVSPAEVYLAILVPPGQLELELAGNVMVTAAPSAPPAAGDSSAELPPFDAEATGEPAVRVDRLDGVQARVPATPEVP